MKFKIEGECVPKGRPRFTKAGITYTPPKTKEYENRVRESFVKALPEGFELPLFKEGEPVTVHVVVGIRIPKSYTKKQRRLIEEGKLFPTKRPDIDNYVKSICDALNEYGFADDSQVCSITATKMFTDLPHASVWIEAWDID